MHIRTFRAANLNDALAMIRAQMGPEASVLHTRELPPKRLTLFGRKQIEVTAGLKPLRCSEPAAAAPSGPPTSGPTMNGPTHSDSPESCPPVVEPSLAPRVGRAAARPAAPAEALVDELIDTLIDVGLPRRIATLWAEQTAPASPAEISPAEISPAETSPAEASLIRPPHDPRLVALAQWLERTLRIGNPIEAGRGQRRVVALVGPTGVGKTTTIAKLAAGLQLQQNARVGLLTLDTFRAAAIEQLDAFARALGVPLAVARAPSEVAGALERLGDLDLVLIDTVGQSPRGEEKIAAMGRLLAAARPDETHLVVDANGSFGSAADVCTAFQPLQPTAAIISKMDEVWRPAPVIAAVLEGALQISYVTTGQRVPEDLAAAARQSLAAAASGLAASGLAASGRGVNGLAAAGRGA